MHSHSFFNMFTNMSATITLEEESFVGKVSWAEKLVKLRKSTFAFGLLELLWLKENFKKIKVSSFYSTLFSIYFWWHCSLLKRVTVTYIPKHPVWTFSQVQTSARDLHADLASLLAQAANRGVLLKKMFLRISKKNVCVEVFF